MYETTTTVRNLSTESTYRAALQRPDLVFLLGTEPDRPEIEYGWIEPGSAGAFRALLYSCVPEMARAFELVEQFNGADADIVERLYNSLAPADFSTDVLACHPDRIGVMHVPHIGWTDLGQPARLHSFLHAHGSSVAALCAAS